MSEKEKTATERRQVVLSPIGVIRSPHRRASGTPIQSVFAAEADGEIVVDERFEPALQDIDGFERIWLIFYLDRAGVYKPRVVPYRDTREHGLFATRSPCRPNPVGLSVVRLLCRSGNVLRVRGLDILDQTPLLDIKPYVPEFDAHVTSKAGWLDECGEDRRTADERFHETDG
jgi:tRNA-Thr(GGU) m(6)t(6)A37 methyltransferase TsaA